jgi:hypothetical protein
MRKAWVVATGLAVVALALIGTAVFLDTRQPDPFDEFAFLGDRMRFKSANLETISGDGIYFRDYACQVRADERQVMKEIRANLTPANGWKILQPYPKLADLVCIREAPGKPRLYVQYRAPAPGYGFIDAHYTNRPLKGFTLWVERLKERVGFAPR